MRKKVLWHIDIGVLSQLQLINFIFS